MQLNRINTPPNVTPLANSLLPQALLDRARLPCRQVSALPTWPLKSPARARLPLPLPPLPLLPPPPYRERGRCGHAWDKHCVKRPTGRPVLSCASASTWLRHPTPSAQLGLGLREIPRQPKMKLSPSPVSPRARPTRPLLDSEQMLDRLLLLLLRQSYLLRRRIHTLTNHQSRKSRTRNLKSKTTKKKKESTFREPRRMYAEVSMSH